MLTKNAQYVKNVITFLVVLYILVLVPLLTLTSNISSITPPLSEMETSNDDLENRIRKLQDDTVNLSLKVTRLEELVLNMTFLTTLQTSRKLYDNLYAQVSTSLKKQKLHSSGNSTDNRQLHSDLKENMRFLQMMTGKIRSLYKADRIRKHKNLSEKIQQKIFEHQHPKHCDQTLKLVCDLSLKPCGFGCQIHFVAVCLIASLALNRTMILRSHPWNYSPGGWEKYFQPVTNCKISTDSKVPIQIYPPPDDHRKYPLLLYPLYVKPAPKWLPLTVPRDILPLIEPIHEDPGLWWVGQLLFYLFKLQPNILEELENEARKDKFEKPCVGIHIRRTDKLLEEAKSHSLKSYLSKAEEYWEDASFSFANSRTVPKRVFLASDDLAVIRQFKRKFGSFITIYGQNNPNRFSGSLQTRYSEKALLEVIRDIHFLSKTSFLVCTFSSLICKMAYALNQVEDDTSKDFHSLDDNYWFPAGTGKRAVALFDHHNENTTGELEIQRNDFISGEISLQNGFNKGTNERNGRTGQYPSYKTQTVSQPAPFDLFVDQHFER